MGKRKAAKKPNKKAKLQPLDKVFRCLFCQHAGVVHCKMDRQEMISRIECARCAQYFEAKIDHLTEPIDVYSLWIDAAELANKHQDTSANASQHPSRDGHQQRANPERPRPSARPSGRASPKAPRREEPAENYDALNDDNDDLPENIF